MWLGAPILPDILAGDHQVTVEADAWYDGKHVAGLEPVSWSWEQQLGTNVIRTSMSMTVDDADGALQPLDITDPLAPFGQQVRASVTPRAGQWSDQVPLGLFRIDDDPDASGDWRHVRKASGDHWLPTGGVVSFQLADLLAIPVNSDLVGTWGPPKTGTVGSELRRVVDGLIPLDLDGVAGINNPLPTDANGMYDPARLDVLVDLARLVDGYLVATRAGAATIVKPSNTVVLDVTRAAGNWLGISPTPTREGVYNAWECLGENTGTDTAPVRGFAYEESGPTRYGGPLGVRLHQETSAFWPTNAHAQLAAEKRKAESIAGRRRRFTVRARFDPRVEVLDLHRVDAPIRRQLTTIQARVTAVRWDSGSDMAITYEAAV